MIGQQLRLLHERSGSYIVSRNQDAVELISCRPGIVLGGAVLFFSGLEFAVHYVVCRAGFQ